VSSDVKDLDETRRLLYGALAASRTDRWELVGTLVNALAHHSGLSEDPMTDMDYLVGLVEIGGTENSARALAWIDQLTARQCVSS